MESINGWSRLQTNTVVFRSMVYHVIYEGNSSMTDLEYLESLENKFQMGFFTHEKTSDIRSYLGIWSISTDIVIDLCFSCVKNQFESYSHLTWDSNIQDLHMWMNSRVAVLPFRENKDIWYGCLFGCYYGWYLDCMWI